MIPAERRKCEDRATRAIQKAWRRKIAQLTTSNNGTTTENPVETAVLLCQQNVKVVAEKMGLESVKELQVRLRIAGVHAGGAI
mgnify:CR=1 FL=1